MDNPYVVALVTLVAVIVVVVVLLMVLSGGDWGKLGLAFRSFRQVLRDPAFAGKVEPLLAPLPAKEQAPPRPSGVPLRALAMLQREGRLVDFLLEEIAGYADSQVADGVRYIHPRCQAALKKYVVLEPVLSQAEGDTVQVPAGFDPSAIRLIGNVTGQPPFQGVLKHAGWRVKELNLPAPPEGQDELILMPAEVELP